MVEYYTVWAHQIKTPIASMRLQLQSVDSDLARRLDGDLNRIEAYVEMVLTFLRLDSDSTDYVIRKIDLDALIKPAIRKFARDFITKKLTMDFKPTEAKVLSDEKWLSFVIECLDHAKSLYAFSDSAKSDAGYTAANGFYNSWSGFYDELSWAGCWLYTATGDSKYLDNAKSCFTKAGHDFDWALCWDDVHIGAALMLAKITGDKAYKDEIQKHLDFWSCGTSDGKKITYSPKGLAWLDQWGSLRYATTTAYVAAVYSRWDGCPKDKVSVYWDFAVSQADYALGSSGRSYVVGFGENPPSHPHHRTSQGSYCDNMNEPSEFRHTLYGALVGGPDASDGYTDTVTDYCKNEVACDYNAGFTGLLAAMYSKYHGKTLIDFGAVEEVPGDEYSAECSLNVQGKDFAEIKALIYNKTAWPARASDKLEFRYYVDLSEVYKAGPACMTT